MVLDLSLLNTQHYKVWIKGKVEQSRERGSALPNTSIAIENEPSGHPRLQWPTSFVHLSRIFFLTFITYGSLQIDIHIHTSTHPPPPHTHKSSSSSSRRTINTDIPDPLSPPSPIIHCFRQVFRITSCIGTELLYVGSSWSSCLCSSM